MKPLKYSIIRGKLIIASILLLVGFIIIGFTYTRSIQLKEELINSTNTLTKYQILAKEAFSLLSHAQRMESEFNSTKNIQLVKNHGFQIKNIYKIISEMSTYVPSKNELQLLKSVKLSLNKYEVAFKRNVLAILELGLNENLGLLGSLKKSAQAIERPVNTLSNTKLSNVYLKMRYLEKNFLLYGSKLDINKLEKTSNTLSKLVLSSNLTNEWKKILVYNLQRYRSGLTEIRFAVEDIKEDKLVLTQKTRHMESRLNELLNRAGDNIVLNREAVDNKIAVINKVSIAITVGISVVITLLFISLTRRLFASLKILSSVIQRVSEGDYLARTNLESNDELGEIGRSFDKMLDERVSNIVNAEKENNQLNDSIVQLLDAVSILSQKDLTVTVPIAENVTGAVGDAINLLTSETANILLGIKNVALQVDRAAGSVRNQSNKVSGVAENERKVLQHTVKKLEYATEKMNSIASSSEQCNDLANEASESTNLALKTVSNAVIGMAEIRETISETEKRIKRLAERSQEITQIVEIINGISERTHILALNASMQAAAAGEAGRGFAVVADEVQRLAENSKVETAHISELISSIQSETSSTMLAMSKAISQVVRGSELAETAGQQMIDTQQSTSKLVASVAEIALASVDQAKVNTDIGHSAALIQKSTQETRIKLDEQAEHTKNLVIYAEEMLNKVNEFKLPNS